MLDAILFVALAINTLAQIFNLIETWRAEKRDDRIVERQENLDKRLSLLLEASELQHSMISSDRDDIERLMKAFNAPRN